MGIFNCCGCGAKNQHTVFLLGSKEHKDAFLRHVLSITPEDKSFSEYKTTYEGLPIVVQSCDIGTGLAEINDLHAHLSAGIVFLSTTDEPISSDKPTLFVLMGQRTRQESEGTVNAVSVVDGSYEEAVAGFKRLVEAIRASSSK